MDSDLIKEIEKIKNKIDEQPTHNHKTDVVKDSLMDYILNSISSSKATEKILREFLELLLEKAPELSITQLIDAINKINLIYSEEKKNITSIINKILENKTTQINLINQPQLTPQREILKIGGELESSENMDKEILQGFFNLHQLLSNLDPKNSEE